MTSDGLSVLAVVAGIALLAGAAIDVFSTVFVPRRGAGWFTARLYATALQPEVQSSSPRTPTPALFPTAAW